MLKVDRARASLKAALGRSPTNFELSSSTGVPTPIIERKMKIGLDCKQTMVRHNLRLVYSVAKNYTQRGVSIDDLVSVSSFLSCFFCICLLFEAGI